MSLLALLAQYVARHSAGDVEGLLALHTEEAEFLIPGQPLIRGRRGLRDLYEWDAVLASALVVDGVSVEGDSLLIEQIVERNRFFAALGLAEVHYQPGSRFVIRNGLLSGIYPARFTAETEARLVEQFGQLFGWLSANRPHDAQRLLPNGKFRYDGAAARLWLDVLAAWHRARA